jgi:hypothetical protein
MYTHPRNLLRDTMSWIAGTPLPPPTQVYSTILTKHPSRIYSHGIAHVLTQTATLIGKKTCFIVDPFGTCMNTLKGCGTIEELSAAWLALRRHLKLSDKYIRKYDLLYRGIETLSPATMEAALYSPLARLQSTGEQLQHLLQNVPHHQPNFRPVLFKNTKDENSAYSLLTPPSPLLSGFPYRSPEES